MTSTVATASRIRVQQHGDAVIGERVDRVYDERTGIVGEKTTTVAQVPLEGGGTALLYGEQIKAAQVAPAYSARRAIGYVPVPSNNNEEKPSFSGRCWIVPGCFVFVLGLIIMIAVGSAGLLVCPPMEGAGATGMILGATAILMSCVCCACMCNQPSMLCQCVFCLLISLLLLLFTVTLIPNTVFVAQNIDFIFSNGTGVLITDVVPPCHPPFGSVAITVMSMSYFLFVLFLLFCCCSTLACLRQLLKIED